MNTTTFVTKHRIRMECEMGDENPNMPDDQAYPMHHYKVVLKRGRLRLTTHFSMGQAHCREPEAAEVLDCLASDSSGVDNARGFDDWASDLGYDTDSRKALETFEACERQAVALKKFLGPELYEALLYKTERL